MKKGKKRARQRDHLLAQIGWRILTKREVPPEAMVYYVSRMAAKGATQPKRKFVSRFQDFYRSAEWKAIRFDVIAESSGRCTNCGASPQDGARLNVDHIIPLSRAWERRLDRTNLQVLCASCNQGKGGR